MIQYAEKLVHDQKTIPVKGEYDVVIVGGGIAGSAAAMAAGKRGCKVLVIEATSALGGLATMGLVNIPLDFVSGLGVEMFSELEAMDAYWHRNTDPEKHKLVLDRMVKKYHSDILLATHVIDAIMDGNTIRGIVIHTKTGPEAILAKRVIDCSGDSDAAYFAGAELMQGRPEDGMSQACSLEFVMGGVNWDQYLTSEIKKNDPRWLEVIQSALKAGDLPYEVDNHLNWITHLPGRPQHCGKDEVSICFAHSRHCFPNSNRDLTRMYLEGREQVDFISRFIQRFIPGFEHAYLSYSAPLLGVRESRRIVGEYVLTALDLANMRKFDDVIAISMHGFDVHNFDGPGNIKWAPIMVDGKRQYVSCSTGAGSTALPPEGAPIVNIQGQSAYEADFIDTHYDIPWRAMIPVRVDGLLAAGRNLSTDVYAQAGTRLIMLCFTLGEVAGTAAAMSIDSDLTFRALDRVKLQQELIASNVNIGQGARQIPGLGTQQYQEQYARDRARKIELDPGMKRFLGQDKQPKSE